MAVNFGSPAPTPAQTLIARQAPSSSTRNAITLALTTIFTPPPQCNKPILHAVGNSSFWDGVDPVKTASSLSALLKRETSCYPDKFYLSDYVPVFSPGVCPSGFTIAEQKGDVTTFATCSPSGSNDRYGLCDLQSYAVTIVRDGQSKTYFNEFDVLVPPVTIAWQSSDLSNFMPPSAPVLTQNGAQSTTSTSPASPYTSTRSTTPTSKSDKSGSLSTGAEVGIGVGIGVGVLAIIGLLIWALFERRKRKRKAAEQWSSGAYASSEQNQRKIEMDGKSIPSEMSPHTQVSEVEGDWSHLQRRSPELVR